MLSGRDANRPPSPASRPRWSCLELPLDEARTLADELLAPSGGGAYEYGGIVVEIDDLSDASPLLANGFPPSRRDTRGDLRPHLLQAAAAGRGRRHHRQLTAHDRAA